MEELIKHFETDESTYDKVNFYISGIRNSGSDHLHAIPIIRKLSDKGNTIEFQLKFLVDTEYFMVDIDEINKLYNECKNVENKVISMIEKA